jgi:hypothetical protein
VGPGQFAGFVKELKTVSKYLMGNIFGNVEKMIWIDFLIWLVLGGLLPGWPWLEVIDSGSRGLFFLLVDS